MSTCSSSLCINILEHVYSMGPRASRGPGLQRLMHALVDLIHITLLLPPSSWLPYNTIDHRPSPPSSPSIETFWGIPWPPGNDCKEREQLTALGFNIESTSQKQTEIATTTTHLNPPLTPIIWRLSVSVLFKHFGIHLHCLAGKFYGWQVELSIEFQYISWFSINFMAQSQRERHANNSPGDLSRVWQTERQFVIVIVIIIHWHRNIHPHPIPHPQLVGGATLVLGSVFWVPGSGRQLSVWQSSFV